MTTDNLSSLMADLYNIRQQKNSLEKTEKDTLAKIKPLVDPQFDTNMDLGLPVNETVIHAGNLVMSRILGTSRTIQADLLLEQGVDADTIIRATKASTYYSYRIKQEK